MNEQAVQGHSAVERHADETLVFFTLPMTYDVGNTVLKAMHSAHYTEFRAWPVQVALRETGSGQELMLIARLAERDADPERVAWLQAYLAEQANALLSA